MEKGFSLVEMLVTLAVTSIIVMIALPGSTALINRERALSDANLLHGALQQARLHAVTTGQPTTIQAVNKGWQSGWRIYSDPNHGMSIASPASVIAERGPRSSYIATTTTLQNGVHFLPNGRAILQSGAFQAGTFSVCQADSANSHNLIISKVGRVRRASETNNPKCANPMP